MENRSLKYWKIFSLVLIVLNITLIIFLLSGRPPHPREGGGPGKYIVEKLKFTGQQKADFSKLKEAHHAAVEELKREGDKLRKTFFDGLTSDVLNSSKDSIADKIAENQKQIELVTYNHFEEVKKLCTPEQKTIFNDIIEDVIRRIGNPSPGEGPPHERK